MRFNGSAIATLICVLLLLVALWFQPELPVVADSVSKSEQEYSAPSARPVTPTPVPAQREIVPKTMVLEPFAATCRADVEARLNAPIPEITFEQLPLRDVLTELTELSGITIYFDQEELGVVIDPDISVDVHAVADSMSFKTLIARFVLEPNDLVYVVRDRFLVIMSYDKSLVASAEVVIYDCRDLVWGARRAGSRNRFDDSSGVRRTGAPDLRGRRNGAPGGTELSSGIRIASELHLMQLIQSTIRNEDYPWDDGSGVYYDEHVGSIEAANGLLVIRTLPTIHERVQSLLDTLRQTMQK